MGMDNFGCVNSSLSLFYFCFVTNLQKKVYGVRTLTAEPLPFAFDFVEIFYFVEIQSGFCPYPKNELDFWTKFGSFDPSFNRCILTLMCLKFEPCAYAQITVIYY